MDRDQLEHVIRAAADVAGVTDVLVLGSQSVLGTFPQWQLPDAATRSLEADIAVDLQIAKLPDGDDTELADLIDGAIGEDSLFHQSFGFYGQGVEAATAVLGDGWRDRLVPLICESSDPKVVGWCLDVHDLWAAKAAAGRGKDREFCAALAAAELVDEATCRMRVDALPEEVQRTAMSVVASSFPIGDERM